MLKNDYFRKNGTGQWNRAIYDTGNALHLYVKGHGNSFQLAVPKDRVMPRFKCERPFPFGY
jgi:hypothetical protein